MDFFNAIETEQRNAKDIVKRDAEQTRNMLASARAVRSGADFLYNRTFGGVPGLVYHLFGKLNNQWHIFQQDMFTVTSGSLCVVLISEKSLFPGLVIEDWIFLFFAERSTTDRRVDQGEAEHKR